jgi:hypothetical protein
MLISIGGAGRLGNNILLAADLTALALEHGLELHLLGLGALAQHLDRDRQSPIRVYGQDFEVPPAYRLLRSYLVANSLRRATVYSNLALPFFMVYGDKGGRGPATAELVHAARRGRVVYAGWDFRVQELLVRHRDEVRNRFRPRDEVTQPVRARLDALRHGHETLIGIHVRRGDYRDFGGGQFLFDDATYQRLALRLIGALGPEASRASIVLVSDEPTRWPSELDGVPVTRFEGSPIEDMVALSFCDRILGPPSTFAMSASLIGCVPYLQITDPRSPVMIDRFFTYGSVPFPDHARIDHLLIAGVQGSDVQRR